MDVDLLQWFEDRVVKPIAELRLELGSFQERVDNIGTKVETHLSEHQKAELERKARRAGAKKALIAIGSVAGPLLIALIANALGVGG